MDSNDEDEEVMGEEEEEEADHQEEEPETTTAIEDDIDELPRQRKPHKALDLDRHASSHLLHQVLPRLFNLKPDEERAILEQHGLSVNRGRFTKVENAMLRRSWARYLKDYIVPNPRLMFGVFCRNRKANGAVKDYYRAFAARTKLFLRLAKHLPNRTLAQIYQRARATLSGLKTGADFSEADRATILNLRRVHGEQYAVWCERHGFNPRHARELVRNSEKANGAAVKHGRWSNEELAALRDNVQKVMKELRLTSYDAIPWVRVAATMGRSDVQCRQRFFSKSVFLLVQNRVDIERWDDRFDMARLVALVRRCAWSDEALIDWDFIKEQFSIECFNILLRSWANAYSLVPEREGKTLAEIVEYLYETKVVARYGKDEEKMAAIEAFVEECCAQYG